MLANDYRMRYTNDEKGAVHYVKFIGSIPH